MDWDGADRRRAESEGKQLARVVLNRVRVEKNHIIIIAPPTVGWTLSMIGVRRCLSRGGEDKEGNVDSLKGKQEGGRRPE